jgi:hypothetical protein
MTRRQRVANMSEEQELKEALAALISSTRSRKRPLPLTEIARWVEIAVAKLGSYAAVADRIGLSAKMLKQFSAIRRLAMPVQKLFESRVLDSVDAAAHLAMLPVKDQEIVSKALAAGDIDTADVRAVVQLRKTRGQEPTKSLLRSVKESKTTQEYVAEFIIRGSHDRESMLAEFQKHIPKNEILRLEIQGAIGRLVLTRKGKQAFLQTAQMLGTPVKHVIPRILASRQKL